MAPTADRRPFTVLVEGNVGSGKSTFLAGLEGHRGCGELFEVIPEPVEEWRNVNGINLLDLMYRDPARWSHTFQSYVQLTMAQIHSRPLLGGLRKRIKVMERSLYSGRYCFVENLRSMGKLTDVEYDVLCSWFDFLASDKDSKMDLGVDLIVYLRTSPQTAHRRVKMRARSEEKVIPLEYLQDLHDLHERWLRNKALLPAPVLVVDADVDIDQNFDPSASGRYQETYDAILSFYDELGDENEGYSAHRTKLLPRGGPTATALADLTGQVLANGNRTRFLVPRRSSLSEGVSKD